MKTVSSQPAAAAGAGPAARPRAGAPTPASLADDAYRRLRDKLVMLDIRPGEPINDGLLAAGLGMGRTPVREALKRLEGDRLVVTYPRRGTFATSVDMTELADVSEIRELLEPLAARRAARLSNPRMRGQLREMADAVESFDPARASKQDLMRLDVDAHRMVYRAAANPHLEDALIRYGNLATRIWCLALDKIPSMAEHVAEHVPLLAAISAGDDRLAAELSLAHVTHFEATIRSAL